MKRLIVFITILFASLISWAQPYGNEWINYSQKYYQFPIVEDGVYRITHQNLLDAGVPLNSISSNQFQVFAKEKEIPLFVKDNGDNRSEERRVGKECRSRGS